MKRLVVEIPYKRFWIGFFGSYAKRVKVVEALRCFKCDSEGFAVICRIKLLDESLSLRDLVKGSPIRNIEVLFTEKDGSMVIFMSGEYPEELRARRRAPVANVFQSKPPEFVDVDWMKVELVGEESGLREFLNREELKLEEAPKILSLTRFEPRAGESLVSALSPQQRRTLLTAYGLGYYDLPKRISSEHLASLLKIDKSTLAEHLRKAERSIIKGVLVA